MHNITRGPIPQNNVFFYFYDEVRQPRLSSKKELILNDDVWLLPSLPVFSFPPRLPFQAVPHEQILRTETVLEGGKTRRQQHHRHTPPHQTSRECPPHLQCGFRRGEKRQTSVFVMRSSSLEMSTQHHFSPP